MVSGGLWGSQRRREVWVFMSGVAGCGGGGSSDGSGLGVGSQDLLF